MAKTTPRARVAFLWHMHQPCYEPAGGGVPELPWVRLHATRAYRDLAWVLEQHPGVRMVVNFVPSLLDQLERVVAGASDRFRDLSRGPAYALSEQERRFMALHFFSCCKERLIDPQPRYLDLWTRREDFGRWSEQDLRDLQVHFNLAWMGLAARAQEPVAGRLLRQGRGFSDSQRDELLIAQDRVCARVVPSWTMLASRGQVELTTTPYFHPILPLLIDSDAANRCLPGATLPPRFSWPEDARLQVSRALARHEEVFGVRPVGMWPAEGAVSPEAVRVMAEEGVRWIATDEGVLLRSLPPGTVREHALYRHYRAPGNGPVMLFRDRDLSDRIGFVYAREPTDRAVEDLLGRLRAASRASLDRGGHPPGGPLVLVALDGENPWEGYPDGGEGFLHALCRGLEEDELLGTCLPGELDASQGEELPRLHSGSWIDSSYRIWIGGQVENRAWSMLGAARRVIAEARASAHPGARAALEMLLPAEGSDWFWWFGDDFSTTQDLLFDRLFRGRLRSVYELLDLPVPRELLEPVDNRRRSTPNQPVARAEHPAGFISPTIDGRVSGYYEWSQAVELPLGGARGSMYQGERRLERVLYGFDPDHLFLRVDLLPGACSSASAALDGREPGGACATAGRTGSEPLRMLRVSFEAARSGDIEVPVQGSGWYTRRRSRHGSPAARSGLVVELGIPFVALEARPGDSVKLRIQIEENGITVDRVPADGWLLVSVPDENYLSWSWMV